MSAVSTPAVTVAVITYNSSKTVAATLDSIYNQTYPHLELVISDDCSTDDTVDICRKWIDKHQDRFIRSELITVPQNTGVSANMNRAWDAIQTVWSKDIAGDDLLLPNCIDDNMSYIREHPDAIVVFSRLVFFTMRGRKKIQLESWEHDYDFFDLSPKDQYDYLISKGSRIPTCTCFENIAELRRLGVRNDERIPLMEDYPKWIALARKGIKFHFFNNTTVEYRYDPDSLCHGVHTPQYFRTRILLYLYYFLDEIKSDDDQEKIYNIIGNAVLKPYVKAYDEILRIQGSWDYRVGRFIMSPFHWLKDFINTHLK